MSDEVIDSPAAWVADHAKRYVETDGEDGFLWRGAPSLALTTIGRRSGKPRRTMLIFGEDEGRYLLVASQGGQPDHPLWYYNLVENPEVELQIKADRFRGIARTATAEEKPRLWKIMTDIWPAYDQYQARTEREIPLVIVERI